MRRLIIMTVFLFLAGKGANAQIQKFQDLVGIWDIVGEPGVKASLQIIDSSTILLISTDERKIISRYTMDFSKSPCWFDFSAKDSSSEFQVKSLIQKVGDDVLKWQLFIDETRSPYFTNYSGKLLYLKRAKPDSSAAVTVSAR